MRNAVKMALPVRLHHPCGRLRVSGGWSRPPEASANLRDHELWLVWRGRGWMRGRDRLHEMRPGFCVWMRPGGVYDAGLEAGDELGFTYIHFKPLTAIDPPEFFNVRDVGYVESVMHRIVAMTPRVGHQRWGRPASTPPAGAVLLSGLLLDLLDSHRRGTGAAGTPREREMSALTHALRTDPASAPSVEAMARRMGVTAAHFTRLFRKVNGLAPQTFIMEARLQQAKLLLTESDLPVGRIAEMLGYRDVYFFSKQFKQKTGRSPTAFRRSVR